MFKYDKQKFKGGKEASQILGVHQRTLYLWEEKGQIETIRTAGGKRLYNVTKYMDDQLKDSQKNVCDDIDELGKNKKEKLNICYCRVSSMNQKDDLERQKRKMQKEYPDHIIIEDIGSGLNLNKRGIKKIIRLGIEGKIQELVVAYRDRLTRFGYEFIEELLKEYSGAEIKVMNDKEKIEPEEEMIKDMMAIMNVYVAKMNGMRKYRKKQNEKKD